MNVSVEYENNEDTTNINNDNANNHKRKSKVPQELLDNISK